MIDNIILIGMMGSGKTSVGNLLSNETSYKFIDTDQIIVFKEGMSIPQIFSEYGQEYFRDLETNTLKELVNTKINKSIISTGGGIILRPENQQYLQTLGKVVWLNASTDTIYNRLISDTDRPLLDSDDKYKEIDSILKSRLDIYRNTSDYIVDVNEKSVDQIVLEIRESQ